MSALAQLAEGGAGGAAEFWVFVVVGAVALGSGIAMVAMRNAIHAALMLVINFFAIAVLYAVMEAQFLAVIQLIVYAGAIMVLFLFVLMLLGVARDEPFGTARGAQGAAAIALGAVLFVGLFVTVATPFIGEQAVCGSEAALAGEGAGLPCLGLEQGGVAEGNVRGLGFRLFADYIWSFEVTSALLVIAAIGVVVLGRRHQDPAELSDRGGETRPAPRPSTPAETRSEPEAHP
jgi:NADH-quinone oxidoreductase subunit J